MGVFDIIVTVIIGVAFLAVAGAMIYKKVTRKGGGCGCGCEGCPHACRCKDGKKNGGQPENGIR